MSPARDVNASPDTEVGVGKGAGPRPSRRAPIAFAIFGVLALVVFGVLSHGGQTTTFGISTGADLIQFEPIALPSKVVAIALGVLCLGISVAAFVLVGAGRRTPAWLTVLFVLAFVFAFLTWAVAGSQISLVNLLQGALALSVPLVFGALSGVLCERAGVVNIAIEGQLLAGAFMSAVVATLTGNLYIGLVAAMIGGLLVALILATFAITYVVNQIIVGVVVNVLVLGLTNFFYSQLLSPDAETWNSPGTLPVIRIPLLADIPLIGPVLFNQRIIVYLMYIFVALVTVAIFRTRWGLRVRAVGEHPKAADTVGIDVNRVRFRNVLLGGLVAGLGGSFFTIGNVGAFSAEISAGQGYIALAAMIFGRWHPVGALGAALLFGFANNLQSILGIVGTPIPGQFMLMFPYLATIFAVAGLVGRARPPAASGQHYTKS